MREELRRYIWETKIGGVSREFEEVFYDKSGRFVVGDRFGVYYSNFLWVESLISKNTEKWSKVSDGEFRTIVGYLNLDFEQNKNAHTALFYAALAKFTDELYYQVSYCLKKGRRTKKRDEIYAHICNLTGEDNTGPVDAEICMRYLYSELAIVNSIQNDSREENFHDALMQLKESIERFSRISPLCSSYLSERSKRRTEKERCVAAYFFDDVVDKKGIIAFSGYYDCEDQNILDALMTKSEDKVVKSKFIRCLKDIANDIDMELVTLNAGVCEYEIGDNRVCVKSTLGQELRSGKNKNDFCDTYACCERKIFTVFPMQYKNGKLNVKWLPCERCELGVMYQREHGMTFDVKAHLFV